MISLKNKYVNQSALFISGGVSVLKNKYNLNDIDKDKYTIFLETKALTPKYLDFNVEPDFYLMNFPEKSKDNNIQHFIYRSFMAQRPIRPFLKPEFQVLYDHMKSNFHDYFETWAPVKGPQKRYRWKDDVYMNGSPYDLLAHFPKCKVIVRSNSLAKEFPNFKYNNPIYEYDVENDPCDFNIDKYYNPIDDGDVLKLHYNTFLNSAAIAIYPLLKYLGFKKVYFLGMDMSNVGSMEFSAPYVFKSMWHFYFYLLLNKRAFNHNYRMNKPFYFRPQSEFEDLKKLFSYDAMEIIRVYDEYKYAAPIDWMQSVSYQDFLRL